MRDCLSNSYRRALSWHGTEHTVLRTVLEFRKALQFYIKMYISYIQTLKEAMRAKVADLSYRMKEVVKALERRKKSGPFLSWESEGDDHSRGAWKGVKGWGPSSVQHGWEGRDVDGRANGNTKRTALRWYLIRIFSSGSSAATRKPLGWLTAQKKDICPSFHIFNSCRQLRIKTNIV